MSTWTRRDVWLALNEAILDHVPAPRAIYTSEWDELTAYVDTNSREDAQRWARRFKLDATGPSFVGAYMGWKVYVTWREPVPSADELPADVEGVVLHGVHTDRVIGGAQ